MPNPNGLVQELNTLDFNVYIGGPLQAAVQAQTAASMAAINFIKEVGLDTRVDPDDATKTITDLRYVDFSYNAKRPNPAWDGRNPNQQFFTEAISIKVPFLTMVVVPNLRIDDMTIEFNAKLTSVETSDVGDEFAAGADLGINYGPINFKASVSYKRTSSTGVRVEKSYSLNVRVHAVQDELPAGLDRILAMIENSIIGA